MTLITDMISVNTKNEVQIYIVENFSKIVLFNDRFEFIFVYVFV